MSILRDLLFREMKALRTIDCHSHTLLRSDYYARERNFFTIQSYFTREIMAYLGKPAMNKDYDDWISGRSEEENWELFRKVIRQAGNTSYWRHNLLVYRKFFGLKDDELNDQNWQRVNEAIKRKTANPDWYRQVTKDICGLGTQMRTVEWYENWEPEFFTCVLRMDEALELHKKSTREKLAAAVDSSLSSLSDLKKALVDFTLTYNVRGNRGIKLAHAYERTLHSEEVSETAAGALYDKSLQGQSLSTEEIKKFQDHIISFLAEMADEMNLVFQIHTGVQTAWGRIPDSNPMHLLPLIHRYRNVKFDLFHMGFPYVRELGMMGKHCPNVYLNMAWSYLVSMEVSRQGLSEWIDLVPGVRLLAFGSDVRYPEMIYGHLEMARSCIADVLEAKVQRDYLSKQAAIELLKKMLHYNGVELYGLSLGCG
ncbi:MAG TPA: hypothetical protein ENI06_10460 [Spirochaetales bacterium]|nr:hypothetical protein [Spirochaetales bacterium]